jgi:hypothetical protein
MDRPKTTVSMSFDPSQWVQVKGAEKTRPSIHQLVLQKPMFAGAEIPFTAFYQADGRLYRVDGTASDSAEIEFAVLNALERHWWRLGPELPF